MATTRELVTYILEKDEHLRAWFDQEHGFTLEKAKTADLSHYHQLVAALIKEGVDRQVVTSDQVEGTQAL